jgi:DNA gyrase subunit A
VLVVMQRGKVVRSRVSEVRPTGRDTMGVSFARVDPGDAIIAVARNAERAVEQEIDPEEGPDGVPSGGPETGGGA